MVFTKQLNGNRISLYLILFILYSCGENKSQTGVQLNEFIVNEELDSTINYVISNLKEGYECDLVIELMKSDSTLSIDISLQNRKFINTYIYYYNRRVVGFTKKGKDSIIILSNINHLNDLGKTFCNYLQPIERKGDIHYLQNPLSLYDIKKANRRLLSDSLCNIGNWTDIPYMYEPFVFSFIIRDNKVTFPPYCFRR